MLVLCFSVIRAGLSGAGLTDFADDVADLVASSAAAEGGKGTGLSELFGKHKLSQRYGADLTAQQQAQVRHCKCCLKMTASKDCSDGNPLQWLFHHNLVVMSHYSICCKTDGHPT